MSDGMGSEVQLAMTGKPSPEFRLDPQRQHAIEVTFAGLPESPSDRYTALQAIRKAFYMELAAQFQPALNQFAEAQPQVTEEDWSNLATTVNRMVRHLGLALVSPRDNAPATLVFDPKRDADHVIKRYRFNAIGRRTTPYTCYELPSLELCQAPARAESLSRGFRKTGRDEEPQL
jgi:hypothetical protein